MKTTTLDSLNEWAAEKSDDYTRGAADMKARCFKLCADEMSKYKGHNTDMEIAAGRCMEAVLLASPDTSFESSLRAEIAEKVEGLRTTDPRFRSPVYNKAIDDVLQIVGGDPSER